MSLLPLRNLSNAGSRQIEPNRLNPKPGQTLKSPNMSLPPRGKDYESPSRGCMGYSKILSTRAALRSLDQPLPHDEEPTRRPTTRLRLVEMNLQLPEEVNPNRVTAELQQRPQRRLDQLLVPILDKTANLNHPTRPTDLWQQGAVRHRYQQGQPRNEVR